MNIWVPKTRIIEAYPRRAAPVGVHGEFQITKRDRWGRVLYQGPRFSNLILDVGLNRMGTDAAINGAAIGTGTAVAEATQTALQSESTYTTTPGTGGGVTSATSSPYAATSIFVYRTSLGALNGNYSEVGVGWASGSMFSRELIRDGSGNPTTISVASDEQLDIAYRLSIFPPLTDITDEVTITGSGVHDVLGRASAVTYSFDWGGFLALDAVSVEGGTSNHIATAGSLGLITENPSGADAGMPSATSTSTYANNSLRREGSLFWGLGSGNSADFRSVAIRWRGLGRFQYEYNPIIPKNNTKTLVLNYAVEWARA